MSFEASRSSAARDAPNRCRRWTSLLTPCTTVLRALLVRESVIHQCDSPFVQIAAQTTARHCGGLQPASI